MKLLNSLLIVSLFAVPSALAQQPESGLIPGGKPEKDPIAIYRQAGIDSDQEGEIRKLVKNFESAHRVRLKIVFRLIKEMRDLQFQPDPSSEEVLAKQDEINQITAKITVERVKLMLKIRSVLNPRQKQKLVQILKANSAAASRRAQ